MKKAHVKYVLWLSMFIITLGQFVVGFLGDQHHPPLNDIVTTQDIIAADVFFEIIEPYSLEYTYRLRPAKDFGTTFSKHQAGVALVPTVPSDGCTKLENKRSVRGNVALIDRGECSFLTKTINAEIAGATAAIITEFNSESTEFDYYIEMIHDKSNRDAQIPAGYLLGRNGVVIRNTLQRLKLSYARINLPVNLTFVPPSKINHPPWLGWECSFLTKTINAEIAGATAAIITEFNSESTEFDYYIEMIHDKSNRDAQIPAGYLLGRNGVVIRNTLQRLKLSYARINLPVNLTFVPPSKINHPPWLGW